MPLLQTLTTNMRSLLQRINKRLGKLPKLSWRLWGIVIVGVAVLGIAIFMIVAGLSKPQFSISSSAFSNNQEMPVAFTCEGKSQNPPLSLSNIPSNAQSLAILFEDAAMKKETGKTTVHWLMWNIPVTTTEIRQDVRPAGIIARNYKEEFGYAAPCPPPGTTHTYLFHAYALKAKKLPINGLATWQDFDNAIHNQVIKQATLKVYFGRPERK